LGAVRCLMAWSTIPVPSSRGYCAGCRPPRRACARGFLAGPVRGGQSPVVERAARDAGHSAGPAVTGGRHRGRKAQQIGRRPHLPRRNRPQLSFMHPLRPASARAIALLFVLVSVLAPCTAPASAAPAQNRPNILVILADDLGYGDLQVYNPTRGKIPTPHLDRLAREGMRFTDGHASSAACSPSRYTLLTGRYHWRTRLQSGIVDLWEAPLIAPERLTIASLARQQGYRTAAFGKWHLGWDWPITPDQKPLMRGLGGRRGKSKETLVTTPTEAHRAAWTAVFSQRIAGGPATRGFEHYFGTDVPNWPPYAFIHDDRTVGVPTGLLPASALDGYRASFQGPALPGWRFEDILGTLAERASAYIRERAARRRAVPRVPAAHRPAHADFAEREVAGSQRAQRLRRPRDGDRRRRRPRARRARAGRRGAKHVRVFSPATTATRPPSASSRSRRWGIFPAVRCAATSATSGRAAIASRSSSATPAS
jgi:hypothetical protein